MVFASRPEAISDHEQSHIFQNLQKKSLAFNAWHPLKIPMSAAVRGALGSARVERALLSLQSAIDGDALIKAVFRLLQNAVRRDFVSVYLRIRQHSSANMSHRMFDSRGREYGLEIVGNVSFRKHPGMPSLLANSGIRFVNTREILPSDTVLQKTHSSREFMHVTGVRHGIGIFFSDQPQTPKIIFSLLRERGQPDLSDKDVAVLNLLHPHIAAAFRRVRETENERAVRKELHALAERTCRAACVLDSELRVADFTRAAREQSAKWHSNGEEAGLLKPPPFRLPAVLHDACTELSARWRASLRRSPGMAERCVVVHPSRPELRATVSLRPTDFMSLAEPGFLIEFERSIGSIVTKDDRETALERLSYRERILVRLVCAGKSNQEIPDETRRTIGTVKNALHLIFGKLGVHSRSALIAFVASR